MKTCSKCKIEKPLTEFYKKGNTKDGLHSECKSCIKERSMNYYYHNQEAVIERQKKYREANREALTEQQQKYYQENKEAKLEQSKRYWQDNKEAILERKYRYNKKRKEADPLFKLRHNLGCRTSMAFKRKRWVKNTKTQDMLGANYETVFNHIASRFKKGMSWDNLGEWHIDHIIPLASANTEKEMIDLCHYTNLQPLWGKENISKGNKIIACKLNYKQ